MCVCVCQLSLVLVDRMSGSGRRSERGSEEEARECEREDKGGGGKVMLGLAHLEASLCRRGGARRACFSTRFPPLQ
jgi:hypothetical protein